MANARTSLEADDIDAYVKAVEDGLRSLDEGRKLPYDDVRDWLLSWGTDREKLPPECP
jgi:predicted transcriptional regulator